MQDLHMGWYASVNPEAAIKDLESRVQEMTNLEHSLRGELGFLLPHK
jgi:hypothetical protein